MLPSIWIPHDGLEAERFEIALERFFNAKLFLHQGRERTHILDAKCRSIQNPLSASTTLLTLEKFHQLDGKR